MKDGTVIEYSSPWEKKIYVGMVIKKASSGWWVLWEDGTHKILLKRLKKHTKIIQVQ